MLKSPNIEEMPTESESEPESGYGPPIFHGSSRINVAPGAGQAAGREEAYGLLLSCLEGDAKKCVSCGKWGSQVGGLNTAGQLRGKAATEIGTVRADIATGANIIPNGTWDENWSTVGGEPTDTAPVAPNVGGGFSAVTIAPGDHIEIIYSVKYIDDEKVIPLMDDVYFPLLKTLSCKLWSAYAHNTPSISYISGEMVNGKPAFIAYVNVPKGTPVDFPAEFGDILLTKGRINTIKRDASHYTDDRLKQELFASELSSQEPSIEQNHVTEISGTPCLRKSSIDDALEKWLLEQLIAIGYDSGEIVLYQFLRDTYSDGIDEPFTTFYENYLSHVSNPMTKNFASRALEAIGLKARMLRIDFEGCKKSAMILRALADELRQLFSLLPS
ncbi:23090_t:CDS:2, partial [Rhizophagus irregularis]